MHSAKAQLALESLTFVANWRFVGRGTRRRRHIRDIDRRNLNPPGPDSFLACVAYLPLRACLPRAGHTTPAIRLTSSASCAVGTLSGCDSTWILSPSPLPPPPALTPPPPPALALAPAPPPLLPLLHHHHLLLRYTHPDQRLHPVQSVTVTGHALACTSASETRGARRVLDDEEWRNRSGKETLLDFFTRMFRLSPRRIQRCI
eukprot:COSAG06_NODE_9084_length_1991_cov_1.919662_1_plen_202_part_10